MTSTTLAVELPSLELGAFPAGFLWGAATAAYQVEGAVSEGGRGRSIWDTFSHTPGRTVHGDTGDIACDHYHRWRDDIELIHELRLSAYRLSVSWAWLQPDGRGPLNNAALAHYRALLEALRGVGVKSFVTLYHWDLPQPLEDSGGWPSLTLPALRRLLRPGLTPPGRRGRPLDHAERALVLRLPRLWERCARIPGARAGERRSPPPTT